MWANYNIGGFPGGLGHTEFDGVWTRSGRFSSVGLQMVCRKARAGVSTGRALRTFQGFHPCGMGFESTVVEVFSLRPLVSSRAPP